QEGAEEVETEFMGETASSEEEKTPQNSSAGSSTTGSLGIGSLKSV
ncbi:MAG: hypothetical protein PWQ89_941, partial [Verrucomicrobiota bacterium]|nr:hypothetical protein [Verrucomicrobiota bacterium]